MKTLILEAKKSIEKENASFGYAAGTLEIAADIWHNHMTPMQRMEISSNNPDVDKKVVDNMYKAVAKFFNA